MREEEAHEKQVVERVGCWVITVSDTRTPETDESGRTTCEELEAHGHRLLLYRIVKDEPSQIGELLEEARADGHVQAVILTGGTGISSRDNTYEVIREFIDKELPGFGELFRWLSFREVGPRAILSRAVAGVMGQKLIFSLPGSSGAVRLALRELILPLLGHAVYELDTDCA
ncbi:MAG: molybdenum cofactor biosynthesis protein B [Candidatus Bipolaricaulia bacterium]